MSILEQWVSTLISFVFQNDRRRGDLMEERQILA